MQHTTTKITLPVINSKNCNGQNKEKDQMKKLTIPDELNLESLDFPDEVPTHIMFPEELNRFLRSQIRALTQENGQLRRSLEECEGELREYLEQKQKNSSPAPKPDRTRESSEEANKKIAELTKRVRHLTAEAEVYKSRFQKAQDKLTLLEDSGQGDSPKQPPVQHIEETHSDPEKQEGQVKVLTEKLNAANTKLFECRNQCQQLKQDLKLAQKVLSNEIGENTSIQSLSAGTSNWRGRAQQILALQQKVSELQERLKEQSKQLLEKPGYDSKEVAVVKPTDKERRVAREQAERDLKDATAQLEECKKRMDGARARNRILEVEVNNLKGKVTTLLEKGSHDDQLIAALTSQLNMMEQKCKNQEEIKQNSANEFQMKHEALLKELDQAKYRVNELEDLQNQKDSMIDTLEKRLTEEMGNRSQHKFFRSNSQDSITSLRSGTGSKSQQENQYDGGQHQIMSMAAEAERVRLLELLAVSNRRLEEQRKMTEEAQDRLIRERKKTARLETKVARLELDKFGGNKVGSYRTARQTEKERALAEEMKDRVELLQEEIYVLQTRLQSLKQEKEEDLKSYTNLLDETRRIFLNTQKGKVQDISSHSSASISRSRSQLY